MCARATAAFLNSSGIEATSENSIQRFKIQKQKSSLTVTLWVASMSPLMNVLIANIVPYVDGCLCLYHDHDALSCVRVNSAMELLGNMHDSITLMNTTVPALNRRHLSRIKTFYNNDGFERPLLTGTLMDNIHEMVLNTESLKNI